MKAIKNLVLKGGGVKGIAYVGALQLLEDKNLLSQLENVAGTSAGAITAALVALDYTAKEIHDIVFDLDFKSFEDHKSPVRIATKYGLYRGDAFLAWIKKLIVKKGLKEDANFEDLINAGHKNLSVFATDLFTRDAQCLSFETTPKAIVAEAVRSSMSIPLFFKGWKFSNNIPNDHLYVDGGVLMNYPMHFYINDKANLENTVGLYLSNLTGKKEVHSFGNAHIGKYIKALFETILKAQRMDFINDKEETDRTININDLGVSAIDFDLSDDTKKALIKEGKNAAAQFIATKQPSFT